MNKIWKAKKPHMRWAAVMLVMAVLAGALAGCGKGADAQDPDGKDGSLPGKDGPPADSTPGRYVEEEVELPGQAEGWDITGIFSAEGKLHLLGVKQEDGKVTLREWQQDEDGFADVTPPWLSSMELPCPGEWFEVRLLRAGDGAQYLFAAYIAEGEEDYKPHLWKGGGEEAKEITPEKWTLPDEQWGGYEMIQGVSALDNGTLAAVSYNSVDILSGEDGGVLESEPNTGLYDGGGVTDGKNLYLCSSQGFAMEIEKRKNGKGDEAEMISAPTEGGAGLQLAVLQDGALIAAGADGIFRRPAGEGDTEWEKLMEGMETQFALSDTWCVGFAAQEDDSLYGLFQEDGGMKLNRYVYDPDAVSVVKEVLKLYTVYESSMLKQAAALYHKAHPEVLISIESAYPQYYYGETDYNAVYQALNTRLMGQDAPDILVMDHLNMDTYASKGLLENLDDIVRPMEENGELLSSVTGAYVQEDGSRYVVPLQFGFYMAVGRDIGAEDMGSLESLADFLSRTDYSYMGRLTVAELVDEFYPFFCGEIVKDKALDREAMGRNLEYLKAIAENSQILDSREQDESAYGIWELAAQAKFALEEVKGFRDCMFPISIADYVKGEYAAFAGCFMPSMQMGICAKSQYKDTARDFLRFALSQTVQDQDYYAGFPVNNASMEKQAAEDRSNYMAATMIMADDGNYIEFDSKDYPREVADGLAALCKTLDRPAKEDAKIREVLIECLGGYLDGTLSKEDTIEKIEAGLKMYLAE